MIEEAIDVLKNGRPKKLSYGVEDELALSVGLSCGGEILLFVVYTPIFLLYPVAEIEVLESNGKGKYRLKTIIKSKNKKENIKINGEAIILYNRII